MGKHATVEQDKFAASYCEKSEPVEIGERCKVKLNSYFFVCGNPRQDSSLRSINRYVSYGLQEMTVTDQDFELPASCYLNFQRVVFTALKERAFEPDTGFAKELGERSVEESIEVSFLVSEPQVSVVARNAVEANWSYCRNRLDKVFREQISAFVDLLKTCQLKFICLVWVDAFSVHDIAEEEYVYAVRLVSYGEVGNLIGDSLERRLGAFSVPTSSPAPKMKV